MKKVITAFLTLQPNKVADFLAIVPAVIEGSNAEKGCISYQLFQDPFEATRFVIVEEWKDQPAIDFHFTTPHFIVFGEQLKDLVAEPLKIVIYDVAAEAQV